ncbi:SnoaL-like protein [Thermosporothrix hazakensis]|jgi:hypothetical protein|uniref:SnoaL-like protein n=1 Tax=Thermosporothrix hazakensis TaxID=644383 RepID=A0A326UDB4_THEHA|nr:nuclear transport factor 2 family protein [Thermosporothrix hazakensis]PZW36478.1 SnoaL-like protein [Thermosporothrix hazakensis]GCE47132.1 polyketide cyclase [Thermosporothrix hazakensis]
MHSSHDLIERFWQTMSERRFEDLAVFLHDDFTCEWPQTRERIRGKENYIAVNANYPGEWTITIHRILASENEAVTLCTMAFQGQQETAISFFELRDSLIVKEVDYWPEPYTAPDWRAQWVEIMK